MSNEMVKARSLEKPHSVLSGVFFLLIISSFVALRLLILWTNHHIPVRDDFEIGTIAYDRIEGDGSLSVFDYLHAFGPHQAGLLIQGAAVSLLYRFLGPYGIIIKVYNIMVACGLLCVLYMFARKYFDALTAIITALLFAFALPLMTWFTLISHGPHMESMLVAMLIGYFFLKHFTLPVATVTTVLLGVLSGLSFFVDYKSSTVLLPCLCLFAFNIGLFSRKTIAVYLTSFAVGFLPWVVLNIFGPNQGLLYQSKGGRSFIDMLVRPDLGWNVFLSRSDLFLTEMLPQSLAFNVFGRESCGILFCILVFSVLYAVIRKRKTPMVQKQALCFLLSYTGIFSVLYVISSFEMLYSDIVEFRYVLHLAPFFILIVSYCLADIFSRRGMIIKAAIMLMIAATIGFGAKAHIALIGNSFVDPKTIYRAYAYEELYYDTGRRYHEDHESGFLKARMIKDPCRAYFLAGVIGIPMEQDGMPDLSDLGGEKNMRNVPCIDPAHSRSNPQVKKLHEYVENYMRSRPAKPDETGAFLPESVLEEVHQL